MDPKRKEELKEAKRILYHLLVKTNHQDLTDNEIGIAFLLVKDVQVQEILEKKFKEVKKDEI